MGKTVKPLVEFSGVPWGTLAQVISADPAPNPLFDEADTAYDVAIQWHLPQPQRSADLVVTGAGESYVEIQGNQPGTPPSH